jgi:hypothetical protein
MAYSSGGVAQLSVSASSRHSDQRLASFPPRSRPSSLREGFIYVVRSQQLERTLPVPILPEIAAPRGRRGGIQTSDRPSQFPYIGKYVRTTAQHFSGFSCMTCFHP